MSPGWRFLSLIAAVAVSAAPLAAQDEAMLALRGRLIAVDGGDASGLRLSLDAGLATDSAVSGEEGRFELFVPDALVLDSIALSIASADDASRTFQPALLRLARHDLLRLA